VAGIGRTLLAAGGCCRAAGRSPWESNCRGTAHGIKTTEAV